MRRSATLIAALLATSAVEASACSVLGLDAEHAAADAVVDGTFRQTGPLAGVIAPTRVQKGAGLNRYQVTWEPPSAEADGVACPPSWFPLHEREQGTFYLHRLADGRFLIALAHHRRRS
jgi:hypothetical protein